MPHDVFISYSSKDKSTADAVCAKLEMECIRCWIAPRDVEHGRDWGETIIEAINGSRVMVLVLSRSANTSPQIVREVERAVSKGIPVIPLRIEDIKPTAAMEYFLSTPHWLDAFTPPLDRHLRYLAQVIQKILTVPSKKTFTPAPINPPPSTEFVKKALQEAQLPPAQNVSTTSPPKGINQTVLWLLASLMVITFLVVAGWWFGSKQSQPSNIITQPVKPVEPFHEALATNLQPTEPLTTKVLATSLASAKGASSQSSTSPVSQTSEPIKVIKHNFAAWPAFVAEYLGPIRVGGYCFVVRDHGKVAASGSGGYARMPWEKVGPGTPWTLDKTMLIGDQGFTPAAVMKLWEDKKSLLDEPFWPYVKDLFPNAHESVRSITIRNLLTHRSGLSHSNIHNIQETALLLTKPIEFKPGTFININGDNTTLLRLVLERKSGESYSQYVKNHLLAPVGATKTDTKVEVYLPTLIYDSKFLGTKMAGYNFTEDQYTQDLRKGWYTSPADWSAFLAGLTDGRILSTNTSRMMLDSGILGQRPATKDGQIIGYKTEGKRIFFGINSSGSLFFVIIHFIDGVDAVLFVNSDDGRTSNILEKAWEL